MADSPSDIIGITSCRVTVTGTQEYVYRHCVQPLARPGILMYIVKLPGYPFPFSVLEGRFTKELVVEPTVVDSNREVIICRNVYCRHSDWLIDYGEHLQEVRDITTLMMIADILAPYHKLRVNYKKDYGKLGRPFEVRRDAAGKRWVAFNR